MSPINGHGDLAQSRKIVDEETSLSTASTAEERSAEARKRGNDFYNKAKFDLATNAYLQAFSLAPNDPAPLSNLSAVQLELGIYSGCILYGENALKLMHAQDDSSPKKQKLFQRLAKARLLLLQDVSSALSKLIASDALHKSVAMHGLGSNTSNPWPKVLDEIPRYRPCR